MVYDYGELYTDGTWSTKTSDWTNAWWKSGTPEFAEFKKEAIQSTHSTNSAGASGVSGADYRKTESVDLVGDLRCTNCHDVHDVNSALGDEMSGAPYLRGTWMGNPYKEDGPPLASMSYTAFTEFEEVPRGGTAYNEIGGYYIDQNSGYPTSGWTLESSAGLCVLCHGDDVDEMDQTQNENLWLGVAGSNGHSNSTIGGTFDAAKMTNIFSYSFGRPTPVITPTNFTSKVIKDGSSSSWAWIRANLVADMAQMSQGNDSVAFFGVGYRGTASTGNYTGGYRPQLGSQSQTYQEYDWGATIDGDSIDVMYHQFSCSKCHNPHASRLPKLLITNCLDIRHNTWDDSLDSQTMYTAATLPDKGKKNAYWVSAQNCHRYDDQLNEGGWNKVSPW
jgi:hypothetical protein